MAVHDNDVIFTYNGLNKFIQLIRQNPEMVSSVLIDNSKDDGYYLSTYGADGKLRESNLVKLKNNPESMDPPQSIKIAHKIDKAEATQDGTVAFKVDNQVWDLKVKGITNSLTNATPNTNIPNAEATKNYINSALNGSESSPFGFIPGYYSDDAEQTGTRLWLVKHTQNNSADANLKANRVYGAVFNDYAEYRNTTPTPPGRVVVEVGDGSLALATKRLQLGANIVSDTFGFAIGQTDSASTPIAVCGRALAYPLEDPAEYTPGAAVCSGPKGTVSLMTREEIREWPDAIIGYVSEIPTYEVWGSDNIKVDGRIWIKVT